MRDSGWCGGQPVRGCRLKYYARRLDGENRKLFTTKYLPGAQIGKIFIAIAYLALSEGERCGWAVLLLWCASKNHLAKGCHIHFMPFFV